MKHIIEKIKGVYVMVIVGMKGDVVKIMEMIDERLQK